MKKTIITLAMLLWASVAYAQTTSVHIIPAPPPPNPSQGTPPSIICHGEISGASDEYFTVDIYFDPDTGQRQHAEGYGHVETEFRVVLDDSWGAFNSFVTCLGDFSASQHGYLFDHDLQSLAITRYHFGLVFDTPTYGDDMQWHWLQRVYPFCDIRIAGLPGWVQWTTPDRGFQADYMTIEGSDINVTLSGLGFSYWYTRYDTSPSWWVAACYYVGY